MNRRKFIQQSMLASSALLLPWSSQAKTSSCDTNQLLTVLHTNDVHSRLDPFPQDGSKYAGLGGVVAREQLIRSIREKSKHVLLLDAGDIFQGTPYFNLYKGEPEMKVMSMLRYDAATIGNHDFDAGVEGLAKQLVHADFPLLNCNYSFANTPLENKIAPYTIIKKGKIRIGIIGVGIELNGLVPDALCKNVLYHDPIKRVNDVAYFLKKNKKCDYIICLSHLGFDYQSNKVSDKILARESEYVNMILGGHTHTFLDTPHIEKNLKKQEVVVNQVGWAGIKLGSINIFFSNNNQYDYVSDFCSVDVKKSEK
ncbi:MAG: metallophosphatase [Chitinophagaceae bacterium]